MGTRTFLFVSVFFVIVVLSCGRKTVERASDATVIAVDDKNKQTIEQNSLAPDEITIIRLETSPESLVSIISRIRCADRLILVKDIEERLLLFDESGAFRTHVGRKGRGPGEYLAASDVYFYGGEIIVVDRQKDELLHYDYDGKFIDSRRIGWDNLWLSWVMLPVGGDEMLSANIVHGLADFDRYAYTLLSLQDGSTENFYHLPMQTDGRGQFFALNPLSRYGSGDVHFIAPFDNTIYAYADGIFSEKYLIETTHPIASQRELSAISDFSSSTFAEIASRGYFVGFSDIFETQDHIFLNTPIVQGSDRVYYLIDKRTNTGYAGVYASEGLSFPMFNVAGSTDTHFIEYLSMPSAKAIFGGGDSDTCPNIDNIRAALADANDDDNPVLILYNRWAI